jgi:outer membrane protein
MFALHAAASGGRVSNTMVRLGLASGLLLCGGVSAFAQPAVLTLEDALRMARIRNGTIMAAERDVDAARQRVTQARALFMPTVSPSYSYNAGRRQFVDPGAGRTSFLNTNEGVGTVNANWRLFDSGERMYSLRASRTALGGQEFGAQQTVRSTLFLATQQFYDALRAQELRGVADAQVERANVILETIRRRIEVQDAAGIEELQALADYQNARVQALLARNRVASNEAALKATIGFDPVAPMPALQAETQLDEIEPLELNLQEAVAEGLANRPDLMARRLFLESQRFSFGRARREAGLTFGVDAAFEQQLVPRSLENRGLVFSLSYPLFDGGRRRAIAREIQSNIEADQASLLQAEREVRTEIEATYAEFALNAERMQAASVARDAARRNYDAAVDSQREGAYDLLQVITAQLSRTTAEANYIEALYDYRISEVRLQLVTGRPVPGEEIDNP